MDSYRCTGCGAEIPQDETFHARPDGTLDADRGLPYCDGCFGDLGPRDLNPEGEAECTFCGDWTNPEELVCPTCGGVYCKECRIFSCPDHRSP